MEIDALFHARQVGTTGHEIVNPDGQVVAWTVDDHWAAIVVTLLNQTESDRMVPRLACAAQPTGT